MDGRERSRVAIVLGIFAVTFIVLAVNSYRQESATFDEPINLTTGYAALKFGDYRLDIQHPPLVRMWAALPLLAMKDVHLNETGDATRGWQVAQRFLYRDNNADQLLYRARFLIVLLGVGLGILVFAWARQLFGFWPGVIVLAIYGTEPNLLAHSCLVTTDLGVTCFFIGTLYFLWRVTRRITRGNCFGLVLFFSLAQVSKYSALLLIPMAVVLLAVTVFRKSPWASAWERVGELRSRSAKLWVATGLGLALILAGYASMWAVYGFRYAPSASASTEYHFERVPFVQERVPVLARMTAWVDRHHFLPNVCAQGFLVKVLETQSQEAFCAGQYSRTGWWYFFPLAFAIKTPVALLILFLAGLAGCAVKRDSFWDNEAFILVPVAVYGGIAMMAKADIGLRYALPVYPLVLMMAGKGVAELWNRKQKVFQAMLLVLCLGYVAESARVYPHCLAFFNEFVGGPRNGYKYLVDSNLDWGQDLKGLKRWMDENEVTRINLSYFGTADPAYYGIDCTFLPGSTSLATGSISQPVLPGYVAVSATNLRGVYMGNAGRYYFQPLLEKQPVAVIGHSIFVYWIDRAGW